MYSLVLMMALSGSADMPAAHGCHGCCGGCYGCNGCTGGGCHGCHGGKHRRKHGCHGCHGCCGGYSCNGGCTGYSCNGGCTGYSCTGGACYGSCGGMMAAPAPVPAPPAPPAPPVKEEKKEEKKKDEGASNAAPATIHVSLPADAKLTIDNAATSSTSANRVFATPTLDQGKEYFYTLKAQVTREGKVLTATQRIAVRAGETSHVALDIPTATGVVSSK